MENQSFPYFQLLQQLINLQQRTQLTMFQYEDLKNTTIRMRQIHNTEYSEDIKKNKGKWTKKKNKSKTEHPVQLFLSECNTTPLTQAPQHS